jgi:hypothetical protein
MLVHWFRKLVVVDPANENRSSPLKFSIYICMFLASTLCAKFLVVVCD